MRAAHWAKYLYWRRIMEEEVIPAFRSIEYWGIGRLERCGEVVRVLECRDCGTRHFAGFSRCKDRWCLPCSRVKALIWIKRTLDIMDKLGPSYDYHMITFTVQDKDDLAERISFLYQSWRRLVHGRATRERFHSRFVGGQRSLEVKLGANSGKWHVHYHCLAATRAPAVGVGSAAPRVRNSFSPEDGGEFGADHSPTGGTGYQKDFDWLMPAWKKATDGQGSVEIHKVKERGLGRIAAIVEVLKYISKPGSSILKDRDRLQEMVRVLRHVRQVNAWGCFRGMVGQVERDLDRWEEKKLAEFICQRCGCTEGELYSVLEAGLVNEVLYDILPR